MWMDEKTRELKERISAMSDEALLRVVEVEFDDYRKEAIDFAKAELTARGIDFQEASGEEQITGPEAPAKRIPICTRCGSGTRLGVLLGEKEITILFSDEDEQRFVEVYACRKCGQVHLAVDFETEVDENPTGRIV
jgi:hypothetical protein